MGEKLCPAEYDYPYAKAPVAGVADAEGVSAGGLQPAAPVPRWCAAPLLTCFSKHSFADRGGFGDGARSHTQPSNRYSPEGRELESFSK